MSTSVAVFWDYENCALPALEPSFTIVNEIRRVAHQYGSVTTFKAYLEYPEILSIRSVALRSELQSCGVSLIDCPHNGRKDVADKMIIVDMMAHAIDTPAPATLILISGDRDFVYAVSILALRQYRIVLLAPRTTHSTLKAQAEVVYTWPDDLLPESEPPSTPSPTLYTVPGVDRATGPDITTHEGCASESTPTSPIVHSPPMDGRDPRSPPPPIKNWVYFARLAQLGSVGPPSPPIYTSPTSELRQASTSSSSSTVFPTPVGGNPSVLAPPYNSTSPPRTSSPQTTAAATGVGQARDSGSNDFGSPVGEWQTYAHAVKTRLAPAPAASEGSHGLVVLGGSPTPPRALPPEFRPLVKVLKRQFAEGVVRVESSQLGQFLSQEVQRLGLIYERAGVARLKEYTARAAELGIVVLSREGADGHNYVALHPAHRRRVAEHMWG